MINQETLLILIYGIETLACIIIGFLALKYGKDLYFKGIGIQQDGSSIEIKGVKTQLKTVGSVLMLTSFAWGFLGWQIIPDYSKTKDKVNIGNLDPNVFKSSTFSEFEKQYLTGIESNPELTFDTWKTLAEKGVPEAEAVIGYAYFNGIGVEQNIDSSKAWLERLSLDYSPFVKDLEIQANNPKDVDFQTNDNNEQ